MPARWIDIYIDKSNGKSTMYGRDIRCGGGIGTITDVYIGVLPFMGGHGCGDCLADYLPKLNVVAPRPG